MHISNAAPKTDHRGHGGQPGGQHMGMPRGGPVVRGDKGPSPYGPGGPYGQGLNMAGGPGSGWSHAGATGGRGSIEMPNIQALGLSSGPGGGQSASNPMAGLNLGALPMNPALVAAALNQAGWSLMSGLQGGGGPNAGPGGGGPGGEHGPFTPTSFSNVTSSQVGPGHNTMTSAAAQQGPAGNNAGILTGWGPSAAGGGPGGHGGEAIPAQTPPTVTPQHHPGSWPSQPRDKHGNSWKYSDMP